MDVVTGPGGRGVRPGAGPAVRLVRPRRPVTAPPPELDDGQAQVVARAAGSGPLVVLGAPGSGRTTALVEAVVARVERDAVPADGVLVLAPTRPAAAALRDRVSARLARTTREPMARTPHAYAFALLRRARVLEGEPAPRLISGPEQDRILADLLAGHEAGDGRAPAWPPSAPPPVRALRGFRAELRDLLMRAVERGVTPVELADLGRRGHRPEWVAAATVLEEYLQVTALATPGAFDPAAIVDAATDLLEDDADLLAGERERWALVAMDDAHEATAATTRLLEVLTSGGRDLLLTGDPDAATQTFRGARPRGLAEAPQRYPLASGEPAPTLVLGTVHRHGPALREVAARVAGRVGSSGVVAHRAAGGDPAAPAGDVRVALLTSPAQEAAHVAQHLRRRHLEGGVAWGSMAVVVRSARGTQALRRALSAAGVPVGVPHTEVPVREEPAVLPLLVLLRCALGEGGEGAAGGVPLDVEAAVQLLSGPVGGLDALRLRRLRRTLRARELAAGGSRPSDLLLVEALGGPAPEGDDPGLAALRHVAGVLAAGRAAAARPGATAETVLWALWRATGLAEAWRRSALHGGRSGLRADRDLDAVVALFEAAARFVDRLPHAGPAAFLDHLDGQDLPEDTLAERAPDSDAVALVTAQGAAGREWDVVVVAGVQEGVWPDLRLRSSMLGAQALADLLDGRAGPGGGSVTSQRRAVLDDELRLFLVAVSRARRELLVTAVRSEEELPSPFLDLVDPLPDDVEVRPVDEVPRPLTLAGLVAELRAAIADPETPAAARADAAEQLARLALAGVPGADPQDWYGVGELSSAAALRAPEEPVPVSPSRVEAYQRCALRWLLESSGGTRPSSAAQLVGTLVHEIAQEAPEGDRRTLLALLDDKIDRLGLSDGWVGTQQRERAQQMVLKLAEYIRAARADGREVVAVEQHARVQVGRALVRGTVDRLERDREGRLHVVDLKTGRSAPTRAELGRNAQLGVYQVTLAEGAFDEVTGGERRSGGAELVQLGTPTKRPGVQPQPPLAGEDDPQWAHRMVEEVADGMAGAVFPARQNPMCRVCAVRAACPLQAEGRQVAQ